MIFLVFGVHVAKAEEQEMQVQKRSEKYPYLRWKRIHSYEICECKWDERVFVMNREKKEPARVRTQEPFKKTAWVGT